MSAFFVLSPYPPLKIEVLTTIDGGVRQTLGANATAGIWATYPLATVSTGTAVVDQIVGTFLFVTIVLAVCDKQHEDMSHALKSLMIGNALLVIGLAYGMNTGYAISEFCFTDVVCLVFLFFYFSKRLYHFLYKDPARDLIPRIFTAMAGWGSSVFTAYNYYFWIPIVGPFIGSLIAGLVYSFFISLHFDE